MTNPLNHLRKQWKLAALLGVCTLMPAFTARQQAHADAPPEPPVAAPREQDNAGDETAPQVGPRGRRQGDLRSRAIRRRPHGFDFNAEPGEKARDGGPEAGGIPEWRQRPNFGGRNRGPRGFGDGPGRGGGMDQDEDGPGRRGPGGPRFEGRGPGGLDDGDAGPGRRGPGGRRFEGRGPGGDDAEDGGQRFGGGRGQGGFGPGGRRFGRQAPEGFGDGPGRPRQFQAPDGFGGPGPQGPRGFGREGRQNPFAGRGQRERRAPEAATPNARREDATVTLPDAPVASSGPKTMNGTISGVRDNSFSLRSGNDVLRVTLNGKLPAGLEEGNQVQLYGIQTGNTFLATNVRALPRH